MITRKVFREFIKDNLITFLSFLFGQNIFLKRIEGRRKRDVVWVEIFEKEEISPRTLKNNWFLKYAIHGYPFDIEQQFQDFYQLPSETKKQWQKVIRHYCVSEEIAGTLHECTVAASVSFSALEGLTRSIISTYPEKDQEEWLKKDLSLKQGKGILDAIEIVAKEEFGSHSEVFKKASQQIRKIRNATVHLDLASDEDPSNALYRWNASQALIEMLLLKKLGMEMMPKATPLLSRSKRVPARYAAQAPTGTEINRASTMPIKAICMVTGKVCLKRSATFTPGRVICSPKSPWTMLPSQST